MSTTQPSGGNMRTAAISSMTPQEQERTARRAATAALVGTAMEWYDFFLFSTAAAIVFNIHFFASDDKVTALLASFGTMAVGFIARPIGGIIFGHLADKAGRKLVLIITVTGIGVATGLIGVLPTFATIGVWAPTLLIVLRIVQGLAVGGEWGSAVTAAVESAPPEKRARYAVMPQVGSPIGTILSSGAFFVIGVLLPPESFEAWGWRIPFLAAIPLLLVALFIRKHLDETPEFQKLIAEGEKESVPFFKLLKEAPLGIIVGFMTTLLGVAGFFVVTTFAVSYGKNFLGLPANLMLAATMIGAVLQIIVMILYGRVGEKIGSARASLIGGLLTMAFAFPMFWLIETKISVLVICGVAAGITSVSLSYAVNGSVITALFKPEYRTSGVSLCSNLAAIVAGFMPMLATLFLGMVDGAWWPAPLMLMTLAAITAIGSVLAPKVSLQIQGYRH
ncbi:MFS transporter [Brevibacterium ravenspurgense]|nr:MFS transporter [Brevibacterium ravenspurgense]